TGICRSFEPTPSAVPRARWFVAGALRAAGLSTSPAELLTSELASNAVDHSITPFEVTVLIGDEVRVEVVDGSPTVAVRGDAARVLHHAGEVEQVPGHEGRVAVGEVVLRPAGTRVEIRRTGAGLADPTGIGLRRDDVAEVLE